MESYSAYLSMSTWLGHGFKLCMGSCRHTTLLLSPMAWSPASGVSLYTCPARASRKTQIIAFWTIPPVALPPRFLAGILTAYASAGLHLYSELALVLWAPAAIPLGARAGTLAKGSASMGLTEGVVHFFNSQISSLPTFCCSPCPRLGKTFCPEFILPVSRKWAQDHSFLHS